MRTDPPVPFITNQSRFRLTTKDTHSRSSSLHSIHNMYNTTLFLIVLSVRPAAAVVLSRSISSKEYIYIIPYTVRLMVIDWTWFSLSALSLSFFLSLFLCLSLSHSLYLSVSLSISLKHYAGISRKIRHFKERVWQKKRRIRILCVLINRYRRTQRL